MSIDSTKDFLINIGSGMITWSPDMATASAKNLRDVISKNGQILA